MIPKIVHKTGPFKDLNSLPDSIKNIFEKNKKLNDNYIFKYYNDYDVRKIIKDFDIEVYNVYNIIVPNAFKADLFRLVILYIYGGIYSDLSQEFLIPLSKIINHNESKLIICENMEFCFIASYPKNEIFKFIIRYQVNNIKNRNYGESALDITGPLACRKALNLYLNNNLKNEIKLGNFYNNNIDVPFKIKYMGNINTKIIDSIFNRKRDRMYIVDKCNNKIIKMYCSNHKKILFNKTKLLHYGKLYKKRQVFSDDQYKSNNYLYITFPIIASIFVYLYIRFA